MGFDSDRTEEKVETLSTMGEDMEMGDGRWKKSLFLDSNSLKTVDKIETLTARKEDIVMVDVKSDGNIETLTTREDNNVDNVEVVDFIGEDLSSIPCFMRKFFREEGNTGEESRLLMVAVHAVFLESGFVLYDKNGNGFRLLEGWAASKLSTVFLTYTIPYLVGSDGEVVESVILNFQSSGKNVNVRGWLNKNSSDVFSLCLNKSRVAPLIRDGDEKKVFEFWKKVKDRLSLPLLIDLCNKTGLGLPPCFSLLPTELKMKILEFLPGVDIAKVCCVSTELKYLSSNSDLWKQKVLEEFSLEGAEGINGDNWRRKFVGFWDAKKRRQRALRDRRHPYMRGPALLFPSFPGARGSPGPFGFPGVVGGDYDRFPFLAPYGSGLRDMLHRPGRQMFSPDCNLGERGFDV
ncbi:hypothetical protein GIB67_029155 [Kingdonia uniflora]|uniref:F-box domain-containing protein n=1 Tax=Kingdonia uniflora TaxID=39325 RepID=A0A7J7N3C0_9MAGN|nr:hypothetical protein GIB67_029155 [Kingdonia uniflora]